MEEITLVPLIAAPLGISAEHPFPVYVGFEGKIPDVISDAEDFVVSLVCTGEDLRFENGEIGTIVRLRGGMGQAMATLTEPASAVRLDAYFLFNNRFSGKAEAVLRAPSPACSLLGG